MKLWTAVVVVAAGLAVGCDAKPGQPAEATAKATAKATVTATVAASVEPVKTSIDDLLEWANRQNDAAFKKHFGDKPVVLASCLYMVKDDTTDETRMVVYLRDDVVKDRGGVAVFMPKAEAEKAATWGKGKRVGVYGVYLGNGKTQFVLSPGRFLTAEEMKRYGFAK